MDEDTMDIETAFVGMVALLTDFYKAKRRETTSPKTLEQWYIAFKEWNESA